MINKSDKTDVYSSEYSDTLNRIMQQQEKYLPELKYFLDTEYTWSSRKTRSQQKPHVVILGTGITEELDDEKTHHAALIGMGFGYGISPCAPLMLITGYAATLPVAFAAVLDAVFALASTVSPVLFIMLLSGILARRMNKEIPQYLTWFRLGCYILMIVVFASGLIKALPWA